MDESNNKRATVNFVNKSERFTLKNKDYTRQFAHVYSSRLKIIGDLLKDRIKAKWGNIQIKQLHELHEEEQSECCVVGTIFKQQTLKPSILREVCEEHQLVPQPKRENYTDETDKLILEDDIQRIRLVGKIPINEMVTGLVCAVRGYVECDGKFDVKDYIFYEPTPEPPLTLPKEDRYILLLSGLRMNCAEELPQRFELLKYWLYGNMPLAQINASQVVRVIIAGNSINNTHEHVKHSLNTENTEVMNSVVALDRFIASLTRSIAVDLMPGDRDLSNFMMPQQAMHACIFPQARDSGNFACVCNPYAIEVEGVQILGCSGQNVKDIGRNSTLATSMDCVRASLVWGHMAPTCPDTLPCYPYYKEDPFVIRQAPHVYFAGNCDKFGTEVYENSQGCRVRMICVPEFWSTGSGVLLNLKNLECTSISFDFEQSE